MSTFVALIMLVILEGCAGPTPPPLPTGQWHQLNEGQWSATPAELDALPK